MQRFLDIAAQVLPCVALREDQFPNGRRGITTVVFLSHVEHKIARVGQHIAVPARDQPFRFGPTASTKYFAGTVPTLRMPCNTLLAA